MGIPPTDLLAPSGAAGALLFAVVAIFRGWLVPRGTLTLLSNQWQARLSESHEREKQWRDAYQTEAAARAEQSRQLDTLLEYTGTAVELLREMKGAHDVAG